MAMTLEKMVYALAVLATLQRLGQAAPLEDGTPIVHRQGRRIDADSFSKDARFGLTSDNNTPGTGLFSSFNFNNVIPQFSIGNDDLLAGLKPNVVSPVSNSIANPVSGWDWNIFKTSATDPIDRLALPSFPALPSVPALPNLPALPSFPALPSVPALPNLPKPELPSISISIPSSSLPALPYLPSLPAFPSIPAFPSSGLFPSGIPKPSLPSLPTLPVPTLPSLPSFPSFPGFSLPNLTKPSSIPGVPASQTQLLVIRYPDLLSFFGSAFNSITSPLSSLFSGFSNLFGGSITKGTVVVSA